MSYVKMKSDLDALAETFANDVFEYLKASGREVKGRTYFGTLAANNPSLVKRLEDGKLPSAEVMVRVKAYMEANPALEGGSDET